MKILITGFLILFMLLFLGCQGIDLSQVSDKDMERISENVIVCKAPYIRFGTSCCLDQNSNNVCDSDEKATEVNTQQNQVGESSPVRENSPSSPNEIISRVPESKNELEEEFYQAVKKNYVLKLNNINRYSFGPAGQAGNHLDIGIFDEKGNKVAYSVLCPEKICTVELFVDNYEKYSLSEMNINGKSDYLYYPCPKGNCLEDKGKKVYQLWIGVINDEFPEGFGLTADGVFIMNKESDTETVQ